MTDDRIERVARAMCQANGGNPDGQVPTGETERVTTSSSPLHTSTEEQPVTVPAWKKYEQEARRFIAAFDACQGR
jgi:hypothetical protein